MTVMKKVEAASDREIVITRLVDAPVERVWRVWTDNAEIVQWWGPHGFSDETTSCEFKEGGIWKHVMIGDRAVHDLPAHRCPARGAEAGYAKLDFRVGGSYHYSMKSGGVGSGLSGALGLDRTLAFDGREFMRPHRPHRQDQSHRFVD